MFRFMKEKYTPFILSTKGKGLVLFGTAALLAAGIYGVTKVHCTRFLLSHSTVQKLPVALTSSECDIPRADSDLEK